MRIASHIGIVAVAATLALAGGAARADTYALQGDTGNTFYRVDLTTGVATLLGSSSVTYSDFGVSGGQLYSGDYFGSGFYRINPANGAGTLVGSTGITNFAAGSVGSQLYEVDTNDNLYSINASTGAATLIGYTGFPRSGTQGLSNGLPGLYYTENANLYQLNTTTGVGALVGTIGLSNFEGMTRIAGQDWAVDSNGQLVTFTPGGATVLGPVETGITGTPYALAPANFSGGVPEPATWTIMLIGIGCVGAGLRMRRKDAMIAA